MQGPCLYTLWSAAIYTYVYEVRILEHCLYESIDQRTIFLQYTDSCIPPFTKCSAKRPSRCHEFKEANTESSCEVNGMSNCQTMFIHYIILYKDDISIYA